jgi:hypothetical protein
MWAACLDADPPSVGLFGCVVGIHPLMAVRRLCLSGPHKAFAGGESIDEVIDLYATRRCNRGRSIAADRGAEQQRRISIVGRVGTDACCRARYNKAWMGNPDAS